MQYYYVEVGLKPGLYTSWPECLAQVNRFSGAVYRKVTSGEAAGLRSNGVQVFGDVPEVAQGKPECKGDVVDDNDPPPWDV